MESQHISPHRRRLIISLLLLGAQSLFSFAYAQTYENKMGFVESIQKTLCLNGWLNTACSAEPLDIISCEDSFKGLQAQRMCQYQKGLLRRITVWEQNNAAVENEKKYIKQKAAADAERKIKFANFESREAKAKDCLDADVSRVIFEFKSSRDFVKTAVGTNLRGHARVIDASLFVPRFYAYTPGIISIPQQLRPKLSWTFLELEEPTLCESDTKYFGQIVSLDGQKIDGFLAFKKSPTFDGVGKWTEIVELQWLGARIVAEVERLKAIEVETDRQKNVERRAEADAKAKWQSENYSLFLKWIFLILSLAIGLAVGFYYRKQQAAKTNPMVSDLPPNLPPVVSATAPNVLFSSEVKINNKQYSFEPSTINQIEMQNAFRGKYPFVKHNVRFEHMSKFIEACNQHQLEKGTFPDHGEQHAILLMLASERDFETLEL